jgi:thymidylate synthase
MQAYHDIVSRVLREGQHKADRTGTGTRAIAGAYFEHDMGRGFPLLTTKKTPFKLVATELEFFIRGKTDKAWLIERNNHIWDEWARPSKAPYGHDEAAKERMRQERDLGPVYGFQWRHFGAPYHSHDTDYTGAGIDQLTHVVEKLKTAPWDRRMIVMAWNPSVMHDMALPPCHYGFQVTVIDNRLNLLWNQRSVDTMLGLPFNIASYGLLLHLLAKEAGLQEGKLVGFLADVHIYENHITGAEEFLTRNPHAYPLPHVNTSPFTSIFDWSAADSRIDGYESYPKIDFPIAV